MSLCVCSDCICDGVVFVGMFLCGPCCLEVYGRTNETAVSSCSLAGDCVSRALLRMNKRLCLELSWCGLYVCVMLFVCFIVVFFGCIAVHHAQLMLCSSRCCCVLLADVVCF